MSSIFTFEMSPEERPVEVDDRPFAKSVMLSSGIDRRTAALLDSRMAGFSTQQISSLYYHQMKLKALETEQKIYGRHIGRAQRLMFLLNEDRVALSELRKGARNSADEGYMSHREHQIRIEYIEKSKNQKEVRAILLELGLAEMLSFGDWKVNREGGERPPVKSFMPTGEVGEEILKEARTLRRALRGKLTAVITDKAERIGKLMDLPIPSAVAIALRELEMMEAATESVSSP